MQHEALGDEGAEHQRGAGDTFVGAFASMLSEGATLQRALEVGCEAAALKCLKAGAQAGMPTRNAIASLT